MVIKMSVPITTPGAAMSLLQRLRRSNKVKSADFDINTKVLILNVNTKDDAERDNIVGFYGILIGMILSKIDVVTVNETMTLLMKGES